MRNGTRKLVAIVALAVLSGTFGSITWAQPADPGALLQKVPLIDGRFLFDGGSDIGSLELYWGKDTKQVTPIVKPGTPAIVQKQADSIVDAVSNDDSHMSFLGISREDLIQRLRGIAFLVDIRVQRDGKDLTDFPGSIIEERDRKPGMPLSLKLTFRPGAKVPERLYLIAGEAPNLLIAGVYTRENNRISGRYYDVELLRDEGEPNVLWLEVYRWPPGDPHTGG